MNTKSGGDRRCRRFFFYKPHIPIIPSITQRKGPYIHTRHIGDDHIHLHVSIPPKYSVACTTQMLKGKTSGWIKKKTKKLPKGSLWVRGYFVSITSLNEHQVKNDIANQHHDRKDIQDALF
jgi:putative transposase